MSGFVYFISDIPYALRRKAGELEGDPGDLGLTNDKVSEKPLITAFKSNKTLCVEAEAIGINVICLRLCVLPLIAKLGKARSAQSD